jgi:hypothetical protein
MRIVRRFVRVDPRRRRRGRRGRLSADAAGHPPRRPRLRAFRGLPPRGRATAAAGRVRAPGHPAPGVAHARLPPQGSAARLEPAPRRPARAPPGRRARGSARARRVGRGGHERRREASPERLGEHEALRTPVVGSQTRVRGRGAPGALHRFRARRARRPPRGRVRRHRLRARRRRLRRRRLPLRAPTERVERR